MSAFASDGLPVSLKNSTINFVTDCGADPTGASDCTAALNAAGVLLTSLATDPKLPKQSLRLFIPRGHYKVTGAPTSWTYTQNSTPFVVEILGIGDTSIIECGNDGNIVFPIASPAEIRISNITIVGTKTDGTNDTGTAIYCPSLNETLIEKCRFIWLQGSDAIVKCGAGALRIKDSFFGMTKVPTPATVLSAGTRYVTIEDCAFTDYALAPNAFSMPSTKLGGAVWFKHDDTFSSSASMHGIRLVGCWWDENVARAIHVIGNAAGRIPFVELRGNHCNPSIAAGGTSTVRIENVDTLVVDGHNDSGSNAFADVAVLDLVAVKSAHVRRLTVNTGSVSRYVKADSSCVFLEIEDSNINDIDVRSSATLTTIKSNGIAYDLYAANGTIVANQLCKLGASGAVALGTTDGSALMVGAARQAASAAGRVALSRPGQVVPLLNDNNAAIAEGDQVIISASSAGRIRTGTTAGKGVGVAVTGTSGVDAITYVRVAPF